LLLNVQWKPQIRPFFWNLKTQKTIKHCWILQFLLENGIKCIFSYKVACKKFSWSGQRGGIAPWPSPKYATEYITTPRLNEKWSKSERHSSTDRQADGMMMQHCGARLPIIAALSGRFIWRRGGSHAADRSSGCMLGDVYIHVWQPGWPVWCRPTVHDNREHLAWRRHWPIQMNIVYPSIIMGQRMTTARLLNTPSSLSRDTVDLHVL